VLVTADLSFISLRLVLPALRRCATSDATFVLLVKPQFEAGRDRVGSGGVVADPDVWLDVLRAAVEGLRSNGLAPVGVMASPLKGPAGNVEFLLHGVAGSPDAAGLPEDALSAAVAEGRGIGS
jgi:23S rRNA (cytidine1920-2'-O)/16S rRNA (cytidine1409-2'-O)-methyltransferase